MAIVPTEELRDYFSDLEGTDLDTLDIIHNSVEDYVKSFCKRTFESTSYSLEKYDGNGYPIINLNNYPLIAVDRIALNTVDAIKIKNTSSGTSASVSVTSTGLRLVKNGTADTSVLFATYGTMATVVAAVNALGNGWSAEVVSSTYNSFLSTDLIKVYGKSVIDSNFVYLEIPDEGLDSFEVDEDNGQIIRYGGWPKGKRNIYVDYTAGYAAADMPEDLKLAVKLITQSWYNRKEDDMIGTINMRAGEMFNEFEKSAIPKEALNILYKYRRFRV